MTFPGLFNDSLMADQLHNVSLSFLVDDLQIRRGGVAANISFGMGVLGGSPLLVAAVGSDFAEYQSWLEGHGVDCNHVHISKTAHTARFMCTTDQEQNQIASFYPGAMSESIELELAKISEKTGGIDLVLIGADDPDAMRKHTVACKTLGIPFVADPSQQLPRLDSQQTIDVVEGAKYLFNNEYEATLIEQRTGWSTDEVLETIKEEDDEEIFEMVEEYPDEEEEEKWVEETEDLPSKKITYDEQKEDEVNATEAEASAEKPTTNVPMYPPELKDDVEEILINEYQGKRTIVDTKTENGIITFILDSGEMFVLDK
jgi:hypothetical protein